MLSSTEHSIEVRHLTKYYGSAPAIKDVSFSVRPGEVVGFLGPNGAGKSTTLRILSGLLRADRGEAYIDGISVARDPERVKERIGFMPENNPLPEDLRVVEYLRYRAKLKGLSGRDARKRVDEVMERCDLTRHARRKLIGNLSKGYRQRVGVADAIIHRPAVTIMDEPTIGLDPHQILQIRKLIDGMRGSMTVILSSHILAEVELSCDRVLIINQGRVVAAGTPAALRAEFFQNPGYLAEISGSEAEVAAALAKAPGGAEVRSRTVGKDGFAHFILGAAEAEDLSEPILHALVSTSGLRVRRFERQNPTLEDIFLAATRRSWEQEAPLTIGHTTLNDSKEPPQPTQAKA